MFTRREFIRGGVSAFTFSFAAPAFLSDLARAQGTARRNLVVLYLSGGNDALSMVVPYTDAQYYARRPVLGIPAANVLQIGSDSAGNALGLNPRLTGLKTIFDTGKLALIQRTGYENSSRSHFQGTDIWSTANVANTQGPGWLGRYLDTIPSPVDPLVAWSTTRDVPHLLQANRVGVAAIPSVAGYSFSTPNGNTGTEANFARLSATRIASHVPVDMPHLAFVNGTAQQAFATLDKVAAVGTYRPAVTYPNNGLGQALQAVAGAMVNGVGTRVFFVQTGGYDTHAGQNTNQANGAYTQLMATLNDGLFAFYNDLTRQGLFGDTLVLQFSEFGRRIKRERQRRHRSRRGERDDGDGRRRARRHLRHRAQPARRERQPHAREQQPGREVRDRLPRRLRQGHRFVAGREFVAGARRRLPRHRARHSLSE